MTRTVSVLTLARGRADHLANLIRGLAAQTTPPSELVIAAMQDDPYDDLPDTPFPIRQIRVGTTGDLQLAAARNAVARAACGDTLIFLDVDCIPNPRLVAEYAAAVAPGSGLLMGEVVYLPQGVARDGLDYDSFARLGEHHSDRPGPPDHGVRRCEDYRCFWSLNFAMDAGDFAASGGFDERYRGYGGEDTDFGRTLSEQGVALWWLGGATAYHQHHPHHMPPVHHVGSVVRNAELFATKWGHRTMEHWLHAFRRMGLIENGPDGLRVLRDPSEADLALCRLQTDRPYATTRRVLDMLDARTPATAGTRQPIDERARRAEVEKAQADLLRVPAAE